jgi:hypothetical protein
MIGIILIGAVLLAIVFGVMAAVTKSLNLAVAAGICVLVVVVLLALGARLPAAALPALAR